MSIRRKFAVLFFLLSYQIVSYAQRDSSSYTQFIPENYTVLNATYGNLNLDKFEDLVLVLAKNGEDTLSDVVDHPEKRPLLILLGDAKGGLTLAAKNDNVVYCIDCGGVFGNPFEGITIKNGYFSVEHYGGSSWRWTRIVTFKYSAADKQWWLHRDGGESYHTSDPNKVSQKVRTTKDFGKVLFQDFDIYADTE